MIEKMRPSINKYIKSTVINIPKKNNIPVVQIETQLDEINEEVKGKTVGELENLFGIKFNM